MISSNPHTVSPATGILCAFSGVAMFSLLEVSSRPMASAIHPISLLSLRFLIGGMVLLPLAVREARQRAVLNPSNLLRILMLSLLGINLSMGLLQWSLLHAPAAVAATLISSTPAFVPLFSWLLLKKKPDRDNIFTILMGVAGVAILGLGEARVPSGAMPGILLALGAAVTFALYTVAGTNLTKSCGRFTVLGFGALIGGLVFSPALVLYPPEIGYSALFAAHWHRLLALGVLVSGIGYIFYFKGLEILGPNRGASFFFLKPVLATLLGVLLLSERPSAMAIGGIVMISAAVLLTGMKFSDPGLHRSEP